MSTIGDIKNMRWITEEGKYINVKDLGWDHLINIINKLERKRNTDTWKFQSNLGANVLMQINNWILILKNEMQRRSKNETY